MYSARGPPRPALPGHGLILTAWVCVGRRRGGGRRGVVQAIRPHGFCERGGVCRIIAHKKLEVVDKVPSLRSVGTVLLKAATVVRDRCRGGRAARWVSPSHGGWGLHQAPRPRPPLPLLLHRRGPGAFILPSPALLRATRMLQHARSPYNFLFLPTFLFVASGGGRGSFRDACTHSGPKGVWRGARPRCENRQPTHIGSEAPATASSPTWGGGEEGTFGGKIGDIGVTMILELRALSRFGLVPGSLPEELNTWQLTPAQGGGCQTMKAVCSESIRTFSELLELKHVTPSPCTKIFSHDPVLSCHKILRFFFER